ncbi:flavodoxin family protein [Telmatospirillum siberiense]|uniref:Flavodoxin family protein n=1 Tax=Telmatospirillum siberiense TaxID=382514 RepID=A0A2N3PUF4_9PROT|nr:flavodoxin family protein [Telmatospirillum siberiense]PKU24039.1 flavodoxin family protein [Telmatospirillum siberiense]
MLISIVYDSGYGRTARQAAAVAEGVRQVPGADVKVIAVADGSIPWDRLEASDAIIFGSPTYNGTLSARLKQFMEETTGPVWRELKWRNKLAAGFTTSGANNGDKLNTLVSMALFAAQHGMIWVGLDLLPGEGDDALNRHGSWIGAMATSLQGEDPETAMVAGDLKTASYLGKRVAELAGRLAGK